MRQFISRTLDPHRFEDLIRELIYDFRDWQSIEATGRSGGDAGFDTEHTNSLVGRREVLTDAEREEHARKQQEVFAIWNFLPRSQQGTFSVEAFLPYADILLIDPNGDAYHRRPHLYVEFSRTSSGPYSGAITRLSIKREEIGLDDSWRRINFFPKTFSRLPEKPRIHKAEKISLDAETLKGFLDYTDRLDTLYAVDNRFDFLRQPTSLPSLTLLVSRAGLIVFCRSYMSRNVPLSNI